MAQAVSRQLVAVEAMVRSQTGPCEFVVDKVAL